MNTEKPWKTGHVVARVTNKIDRQAPLYESIVRTYDQVFDGSRIRSIVTWQSPKNTRKTRTLVDGKLFVREFTDEVPVEVFPDQSEADNFAKLEAGDPRLLGLSALDVDRIYMQSIDKGRPSLLVYQG